MKLWKVGLLAASALALYASRNTPAAAAPQIKPDPNAPAPPGEVHAWLDAAEAASGIDGLTDFLTIVAAGESNFVTTAHNDSAGEVEKSAAAYAKQAPKNPPLLYGQAAAAFGSGGLFGALAPYFLWSGFHELGAQAPLLGEPPERMFDPAAACFAAAVFVYRVTTAWGATDWADVRAAWASPSLLKEPRGPVYWEKRNKFPAVAAAAGVDPASLPPLDVSAWPGAGAVWQALT